MSLRELEHTHTHYNLPHLYLCCLLKITIVDIFGSNLIMVLFSSPGGSPGSAIVLPPALAVAAALPKILTLKFFM